MKNGTCSRCKKWLCVIWISPNPMGVYIMLLIVESLAVYGMWKEVASNSGSFHCFHVHDMSPKDNITSLTNLTRVNQYQLSERLINELLHSHFGCFNLFYPCPCWIDVEAHPLQLPSSVFGLAPFSSSYETVTGYLLFSVNWNSDKNCLNTSQPRSIECHPTT